MFDVFLAHNSKDKPQVRAIANELRRRGLNPWLDDEQIRPGSSFQQEIQQAIPLVKTAAIFIGIQGLGRWQVLELESLVQECVENNVRIIPVLLPGVSNIPENLRFLRRYRFVSFLEQVDDIEVLDLLEWGITGRKLERKLEPSQIILTNVISDDDLSSAKGVDYIQLRDLLKAGKWQEADEETLAVMLKASGREQEGWLDVESIEKFPCTDLRTIDQLWVKYSKGHFGFSVQKRIWESAGGTPYADYETLGKTFEKFGDRVGWRVKGNWIDYPGEVIFSTSAQEGHLPVGGIRRGFVSESVGVVLFSRAETCKV